MFEPANPLERELFELWKDLKPDDAFAQGIDGAAGRIFVPTPGNVARARRRIAALLPRAKDPAARRFLVALRARLLLGEPPLVPETLLEAIFAHMVKEGVVAAHMTSLADDGRKALEAVRRASRRKRFAPGMRALTRLACDGLAEILDTVEKELADREALAALARLRRALAAYRDAFDLPGFRSEGTFEEVFEVFRREGADLGRARSYARALRELWDYRETPAQVEAAGLRMIRREMPRFREVTSDLARELACEPIPEAVAEALRKARGLPRDRIVPFLLGLRERAVRVADKHLVAINPAYETQIIETPPYLANVIPSGAAYSVDTLTDRAREIFLATTDERSADRPPPGELLNLLVHEEYGHCVHGSNSAHAYRATPGLLDVLNGPSVCVSEGLAFKMELDFLRILDGIETGPVKGPEEAAFASYLDGWGGLREVAREYRFCTLMWRIVRFLRVVGDARINSCKQDIVAFVEWAHRATGLQKATVYYQLFPAHQVIGPGYASTYGMIGASLQAIQEKALRRGKALREFNGYAASIGWPARSVYEAKLEAWAKS
jgi:hypothetical protein